MRRVPPISASRAQQNTDPPAALTRRVIKHDNQANNQTVTSTATNAGSRTHRRTPARQLNFKEVEDGDGKKKQAGIKREPTIHSNQTIKEPIQQSTPQPAVPSSNGRPSPGMVHQWKQQHSLIVDSSSDESEDDDQVAERERRRAEADREREKEMRLYGVLPPKPSMPALSQSNNQSLNPQTSRKSASPIPSMPPVLPAVSPAPIVPLNPLDPPLVPDNSDYSGFHKKALKWQKPAKKPAVVSPVKAKPVEPAKPAEPTPEPVKEEKRKLLKGKSVRVGKNTTDSPLGSDDDKSAETKKKISEKKSAPVLRTKLGAWKSLQSIDQSIKIEGLNLNSLEPQSPNPPSPQRSHFVSAPIDRLSARKDDSDMDSSRRQSQLENSLDRTAANRVLSLSLHNSSPTRTLSGASLIAHADMEAFKQKGSSPVVLSPRLAVRPTSRPQSRKKARRVEALLKLVDNDSAEVFSVDDTTPRKEAKRNAGQRSTVAPIVLETFDADHDEFQREEIILDLKTIDLPNSYAHATPHSTQLMLATFLDDLAHVDPASRHSLPPPPLEVHQIVEAEDDAFELGSYEPSNEAILRYAEILGMDLPFDADLLSIPRLALIQPLPPPWKACQAQNVVYFVNFVTGECSFTDPSDAFYYSMYRNEKERKWQEWIEGLMEESDVRSSAMLDMSGQRLDSIGMEVLSDMIQGMGDMEDGTQPTAQSPHGSDMSIPLEIPGYNMGILLTDLNLSNNRIDSVGCDRLISALSQSLHAPLATLDLSGNLLSNEACIALERYLMHNPFLLELNLGNNDNLGNMGCEHLARSFGQCPSLRWLSMSKCGLNDFGCQYLAAGLLHHPSLHTLDIAGNDIDQPGLKSIGTLVVSCPTLVDLRMSTHSSQQAIRSLRANHSSAVEDQHTLPRMRSVTIGAGRSKLLDEIALCIERNREQAKRRSEIQLAFVAGMHPRLGEKSSIRRALVPAAWGEKPAADPSPPPKPHSLSVNQAVAKAEHEHRKKTRPRAKPSATKSKTLKPTKSISPQPTTPVPALSPPSPTAATVTPIGRVGLARENALMHSALRQLWSYIG